MSKYSGVQTQELENELDSMEHTGATPEADIDLDESSFKKRYGDLRRHMQGLLDLTADEVMTRDPRTIASTAMAQEAVAVMNTMKITCLFVQDAPDQTPVGILHIHDCLRAGVA